MRNSSYRFFTVSSIFAWTLAVLLVTVLGIAAVITQSNFGVSSNSFVSLDFPSIKLYLLGTGINFDLLFQIAAWVLPAVGLIFTFLATRATASPPLLFMAEGTGLYEIPTKTRKPRQFFSLKVITKILSIVLWFAIGIFAIMFAISTYAWTLERLKPTSIFFETVKPQKEFVDSLGLDFEPLFLFCLAATSLSGYAKWLWYSASKDDIEKNEVEFYVTRQHSSGITDTPSPEQPKHTGSRARIVGQSAEDELNRDALLAATRRQWITLSKLLQTNEIISAFPPTDLPPHLAKQLRRYKVDVILPDGQRHLLEPDKKLTSVVEGTKGWRILTQTRKGQELMVGLLEMEIFKELLDAAELNRDAPVPVSVILSAWQNNDIGFEDYAGGYVNGSCGIRPEVLWSLMVKGKIAFITLSKPMDAVYFDSCYEAIRKFWSESLSFCTLSSETERVIRGENKHHFELPADAIMEAYATKPEFTHVVSKIDTLRSAQRDTES